MRNEEAAIKDLIAGLTRAAAQSEQPSATGAFAPCRAGSHETCAIANTDGFISCDCQCHGIVMAAAMGLDKATGALGKEWKQ